VPDAEVIIRGDAMPAELMSIARKFASRIIDTDELDEDEMLRFVDFTRELAALTVRAVRLDGADSEWQEVKLHGADLDDFEPEDIEQLRMIALRRSTAATVTARTRALDGAISALEASVVAEREAGATVDGYREFRGEREGAEPGADGPDVRSEPEQDVPGARGPRAGGRRG
jgi:hypothetical protein